jgi:integrase
MPIQTVSGKKDGLQKYLVRFNYTDDNGIYQQLKRTVYGLEEAKDVESKLKIETKSKENQQAKKMTVKQLLDEYISVKKYEARETTISKNMRNFDYYILPTLGNIFIDKLTVAMLQQWKLMMEQKGLSLNTKKQAFNDFRAMLNYGIKMEYVFKNPLSKIGNFKDSMSVKEEMNIYTAQEFTQFISTAKKLAEERQSQHRDLSEWDYYVFFNIAFYTGLRKGEIHALKFSDLNGSYMSVKRSINQRLKGGDRETPPKNKSSIRTLQMPAPLIQIINEHKERQKQSGLFKEDNRICGGDLSLRDSTIQRRNEQYATLSKLKVIRIHDFRHSHVSVLANEGINIQEIARRLGHSRIEMTWNTYSHLYPREEERAVDILNKIA